MPPWHGPLFKNNRRTSWSDNVDLEPSIPQVQHGQPHLNWVVSGGKLLTVGHDHVALLSADHQDPQLLSAIVGTVVSTTIKISLG